MHLSVRYSLALPLLAWFIYELGLVWSLVLGTGWRVEPLLGIRLQFVQFNAGLCPACLCFARIPTPPPSWLPFNDFVVVVAVIGALQALTIHPAGWLTGWLGFISLLWLMLPNTRNCMKA